MSSAVASTGTLLKRGGGGDPEVFLTIAEVLDISGPSFSLATEEVTSHDSVGWREHIPTLKEGGEVSFEVNYFGHTTQGPDTGLFLDFTNRTKRNFQLVFVPLVTDETIAFSAYVTGFEMDAPVEGVLRASITLMLTGSPTWV